MVFVEFTTGFAIGGVMMFFLMKNHISRSSEIKKLIRRMKSEESKYKKQVGCQIFTAGTGLFQLYNDKAYLDKSLYNFQLEDIKYWED